MQELALTLNSNLAARWLKFEQYDGVKFHWDLALRFDPNNANVRHQRAQACLSVGLVDDAQTDLEITLTFEPKNHVVLKVLRIHEESFCIKE